MSFLSYFRGLVPGLRSITGAAKDISGTAKDLTGIRKDIVETKLATNELRERESLIQKATLEDVKKYDQHTIDLIRSASSPVEQRRYRTLSAPYYRIRRPYFQYPLVIVALILLMILFGLWPMKSCGSWLFK